MGGAVSSGKYVAEYGATSDGLGAAATSSGSDACWVAGALVAGDALPTDSGYASGSVGYTVGYFNRAEC